MKRKLITTTALLIGLFVVTLPARADRLGFQIGVAGGHGYFRVGYDGGHGHDHGKHSKYERHHHNGSRYSDARHERPAYVRFGTPIRRHVPPHTCVKTPVYKDVWVPPVYRTAFDGRDSCGRPRYRSVLVKPGYYRTVVSHYACDCRVHH